MHTRVVTPHITCIALLSLTLGCGGGPKFRITGPMNGPHMLGPLRIEATAVETDKLDDDHPFCYRDTKKAEFLLFDVRITNTGPKDLNYHVGHFGAGWAEPAAADQPMNGEHLNGTNGLAQPDGQPALLGPQDMRLGSAPLEPATVVTADGRRYEVLAYHDFSQRFYYLYQRAMGRAGLVRMAGYAPYTCGVPEVVAGAMRHAAARNLPERLMEAQRLVLRPGVVAAGQSVRGYLVFAYPSDAQPGTLTLRLPIQPAHATALQFNLTPAE